MRHMIKSKIIAVIGAAALLAAAPAALAGIGLNDGYDEIIINNTFDDSENAGAPDGTNYAVASSGTKIWNTAGGFSFSKNYYASVDFMLPDESVSMSMGNSSGKVGPKFSVSGNTFRNETGNGKYTDIYKNFECGKWYKLELQGRMSVVGAATTVALYEYNDNGEAVCVAEPTALSLRNFYAGTPNGNCGFMTLSEGICYDNEYAVQLNADSVEITEENGKNEISGGESLQFSAAAARNGESESLTQPKFVWSLSGVTAGDEDNISVSEEGRLTVSAYAKEQNIKVVATAQSFGTPYAEYSVHIKAYDLDSEKFDRAEVSGSESITAGESAQYTFTAYKNNADVTAELTAADYVWTVYDSEGARVLGNKSITVNDGVLTVDKSVLAQNIKVRLQSLSGNVYGDCAVTIANAPDSQTLINSNAFEEKPTVTTAELLNDSWDGSSCWHTTSSSDFIGAGTKGTSTVSGDVAIEADLRFHADGAGIITMRRDGGEGLFIVRNGGELKIQTGSSSYKATGYTLESDKWYHIELIFNTGNPSLAIWEYDESGNRINNAVFGSDIVKFRQSNGLNRVKVNANTSIDNYIEYYPLPDADSISITADSDTVVSGGAVSLTVTGSKDGMTLNTLASDGSNTYAVLSWEVYDSENKLPVEGDDITVTSKGVLSVKPLTPSQQVNVHAVCKTNEYGRTVTMRHSVDVVYSSEVFGITGIGTSEDDTRIVRLYVNKLSDYSDSAVFILAIYRNNKLMGTVTKEMSGDSMSVGENEIALDYKLYDGFDPETDVIKAFVWTTI